MLPLDSPVEMSTGRDSHRCEGFRRSDINNATDDSVEIPTILRRFDSDLTLIPTSENQSSRSSVYSQEATFKTSHVGHPEKLQAFSKSCRDVEGAEICDSDVRREPLPPSEKDSTSGSSPHVTVTKRIGRGLWKDQLLVDRSLRVMALTMSMFAIVLIILVTTYARQFRNRANANSTSVGGDTNSCQSVTTTNTIFLLIINVCATMVLGMSNTYQQLVTSLEIGDLRHVLSKYGDSRVGTNSPFSINHKKAGRKPAWATWIFLVLTSLPVHFLANSLIGPSYIQELPSTIEFTERAQWKSAWDFDPNLMDADEVRLDAATSFTCWSAFRSGVPHLPKSTAQFSADKDTTSQVEFGRTWNRLRIYYSQSGCSDWVKQTTDVDSLKFELRSKTNPSEYWYVKENCTMGDNVYCTLSDPKPAQCRLNVRMSAAFILMACLTIKAMYMCAVNVLARGKQKTQCLTFGDVIVASALDDNIEVSGECMVNAGDNFRRLNHHTCHKHCDSSEASTTGDELGHCQKCRKWNSTERLTHAPQPTIATKFKKSLITNLGNTALTQMCLLITCSLALVGGSIAIAIPLVATKEQRDNVCAYSHIELPEMASYCSASASERFAQISGGFGGLNHSRPLANMSPDKLGNEFLSFSISNGAQFLYSLLYLMLIYNITLISQEQDWGKLEHGRKRIRSTLVAGDGFSQDYLLQLPKKILYPVMAYSVLTHWMLGEALQTQEAIWLELTEGRHVEHSRYIITYAAYPLWSATFLILLMTSACWWAFTHKREGFIPQMYGSIRVLCAATALLDNFPAEGVQWGDLGHQGTFRHAGISAEDVNKIVPNALYAGEIRDLRMSELKGI